MQIPESTKMKLNMLCSLVDPHSLNQTCCKGRVAEQNNVGVVLGKVEGLDADAVLDLCEKLFETNGVGDGRADGVELSLCCMLFFSKVMRDPDVDCLVLMSPAQSESL